MNEIKALIFCNNPIALPALREFLFYEKLVGVCVPKRNKAMQGELAELLKEANIPVFIIEKKDYQNQIAQAIADCKPNIGVLMTFPFILPNTIFNLPQKGFINFHFGLLPQRRGPQPILWHMILNDEFAGVTVHKIDAGIDTGGIILQEKLPIEDKDTYGILQSKLAYLGAKLAQSVLKILSFGSVIPAVAQDESLAAYHEMPTAKDLSINWEQMKAHEILRLVNACNPWNRGAGAKIKDWHLTIITVTVANQTQTTASQPGTIVSFNHENEPVSH